MRKVQWIVVLMLAAFTAPATFGQDGNTAAAKAAATAWLGEMDSGNIAATWETAASMFKAAVTQEAWTQAANGVRTPLGAVSARAETAVTSASSLPGAPDGSYVVIQYDTAFANKAGSVETVTVMLDTDSAWRVAGYFIR